MKNTKSCGNGRGKMDGKGKGKKYLEIEIKMGKMPMRATKKAPKRK
jgi:hypothetical protein